jgi:sirohydrochlorin cobaltochelatase
MTPALLLAGHGSADPAGAAAFATLGERVATLLADRNIDVAGGFIELSDPPLSAAVDALVARGHRHVVAVPVVLAAAGHAKGDIPAALAAQRARHPGLSFAYGRPLGPHPVLLSLLAERISAALRHHHPYAPGTTGTESPQDLAVLLVGRGSTDPDANAETCKITRLLWETHQTGQQRFALAETAFVSLARPGVAEGMERCRSLGARRIVVARYFLFPGVLPDRVCAQASAYGAARDEVDVRCADVLGSCDEIAGLIAQRYGEALVGDIRMNCDMCVYRAALPGFEHRVGAPQRPHYHPTEAPDVASATHYHVC